MGRLLISCKPAHRILRLNFRRPSAKATFKQIYLPEANPPVVAVMPPYSGDWLLMGDGAEGTSTEVADLAGENGTGEGVGAAGSLRIISSLISAAE